MESESAKKSFLSKLDLWAAMVLMIGLIATPLIFWPVGGLSLEVVKKFFLAGSVTIALVLWFIARIKGKNLTLPKTWIYGTAGLFCLIALVSGLTSSAVMSSLLGLGVESGTVFSLFIFFGLAFLFGEYFGTKQKFLKIYIWLFSVFAVAFLFQVVRLVFGNFTPWTVFNYSATNLIGKWNDLGIFAGFVALSSAVILEMFPLIGAKILKSFLWLCLAISILTLALINFNQLWIVLAAMFLLAYIYDLTMFPHKVFGIKRYFRTSLVMFAISLLFIIFGQPLSYDVAGKPHEGYLAAEGRILSEKLAISSLEVRPSWQGTATVIKNGIKADPILGAGPNQFSEAWLANKPAGVNDSQFWNIEPDFGVGFVPTFFLTTGLLGGLALLAFVLMLIYAGLKPLLATKLETLDRSFLLLSFLGVVYLWVMLIIYVPQTSVLMLAFALTGLLVARLAQLGKIKTISLSFSAEPRIKFISAVSSVALALVLIVIAWAWFASVTAVVLVQRAGAIIQTNGNADTAYLLASKAALLNPEDIYYRTAAQVNLTQMNVMLGQKLPQDQLMAKYSQIFAQAKTNVDLAVSANGTSYQNYIARGSLYENIMGLGVKGAYELAKKNYTDALAHNPQGPDMDLALARLEIGNNNLTEAKKYLDAALVLKKDYVDAIYLQSQIYAQQGFLDTAISRAQTAAQLAPNDPGVLFQLGYLEYRNADYRNAGAAMQAAVNLSPNYANALYFLGLSLNKLGMNDKALQVFTVLQQSNPDNAEVASVISNLKAGRDALVGADAGTVKKAAPAKK